MAMVAAEAVMAAVVPWDMDVVADDLVHMVVDPLAEVRLYLAFIKTDYYLGDHYSGGGGGDMGEGLDSQGQYKHIVHMRGLPYRASEGEISQFFGPIETLAVRIIFGRDDR